MHAVTHKWLTDGLTDGLTDTHCLLASLTFLYNLHFFTFNSFFSLLKLSENQQFWVMERICIRHFMRQRQTEREIDIEGEGEGESVWEKVMSMLQILLWFSIVQQLILLITILKTQSNYGYFIKCKTHS